MKSSRLKPLIFLAIPLAVGGLAALFSAGSMDKFSALNQPPLSPPGWLFPIVWGILYILMGTASYPFSQQIHRILSIHFPCCMFYPFLF